MSNKITLADLKAKIKELKGESLLSFAKDNGVVIPSNVKADKTIKSKIIAHFYPEESKPKLIKVTFTKSPTGILGLAYNAGETAQVTKDQYEVLVEADMIEVK